jgi:SRSO17 transposase
VPGGRDSAEREFATKPQLARTLLAGLVESGVPARWVAADEAYGQDHRFRRAIEQFGVGYVLAVPKSSRCAASARCAGSTS